MPTLPSSSSEEEGQTLGALCVAHLSRAQKAARDIHTGSVCGLPWGPLQVGARLEKTDGLLLGWVEKNDILVALSFLLDTSGEDAPVAFV